MGSSSFIPEAEIIPSSLHFLLHRFTSLSQTEPPIVLGIQHDLNKLQRTVLKLQAFFHSTHYHIHSSHPSMPLNLFLRHLQHALDDSDELLLDIALQISKLTSTDSEQQTSLILSTFNLIFPSKVIAMQCKLEGLLKEMDEMFSDGILLKDVQYDGCYYRKMCTSSLVDESSVVGRESDKIEVVEMLLLDRESIIGVIAIVGMAGVGKTTLAQLVYNDWNVVSEFDLRIWVSISAEDSVERISGSIVESAAGKRLNLSNFNSVQVKLERLLEKKKVLIVLDGMWDENVSHWDILRLPFRGTAKGSKILVTTQSMRVSNVVATAPPYHLHTLSDEDCWSLIKKRALCSIGHGEYGDLVEIGMDIAKKCQGLPLAARVIGSALQCKSDKSEWDAILNSKILELPEVRSELLPEFTLGYHLLPDRLKRCFAYCSVFPKEFEFTQDGLAQLWVAEGFVQAQPRRRIDDVGRDYFNILLQRSFFQFSRVDNNKQSLFKMHNLMYELARFVSGELCFRMDDNLDTSRLWPNFTNARHASYICIGFDCRHTLELFSKCSRLRTLLLLPSDSPFQEDILSIPYDLFLNLPCMRVLILSHTNIVELPDSIGSLKHLHYLDVSYTNIEKLPESVTNLHGLDTLKLNNCFKLLQLPNHMKNLINLRHLELDIKRQLRFMPPNLGNLTNLQTLSAFIVGKEEGQGIKELQNMNYLHGSLCITNLENVSNRHEASMARLVRKPYIHKLELQWNDSERSSAKRVFEGLYPNSNIKELTLTGYDCPVFPFWLNQTFNNLVSMSLQNCPHIDLPQFSSFPALRSLYIDGMYNLKELQISHGFLPLKSLTMKDMQNLQQFDLTGGAMPELRHLTIVDCQNLGSLPQLRQLSCLESLEIICCPKLQSLPSGGLPSSLKSLIIVECNILKEKCRENFHQIRMIQRVEIDYELTSRVVAN